MRKIGYNEVIRFFNGECSAEERARIMHWVNQSDEHARMFFSWEEMYLLGKKDPVREEQLTRKAERKLDVWIAAEQQRHSFRMRVHSWMKYAALAFLLAVFSGLAWYQFGAPADSQMLAVSTQADETREVVLPDGSKVWLNENSVLKYPAEFAAEKRFLELDGEAYFEVIKDKHKPFVVKNPVMSVQVLGTKFNFKGDAVGRMAEASLIEGEIKAVGNHDEGAITLMPGQKVELNVVTRQMKVTQANTALDAVWHDNLIPFKNADIFSIAETLEALYKVDIILSPDISGMKTYSGVLKKKDKIEDMLKILQNILHIQYEIRQNTIFLSLNK